MSSKTVTPPRTKTKTDNADQRPSPPEADCCEKIRERAYEKWEAAGCPCCDGVEFWLVAEAEVNNGVRPSQPR